MKSPAQPDPWLGRSIGDRQRYRLDKRLGIGGMGEVFVAMDTLLGKQVALKLLKDTLSESEALRKRFEREVAICAALKSDHIVEISDYGVTAEGHPFYVMEYLRGQSLGQLLWQQQRLSVERTVSIISQLCEGLRLAHQGVTLWRNGGTTSEHVKVVHRDLKPDNIFLVPTALGELVKILDFGIAKIREDSLEQTNLTNAFIGTFRYAAPEQLGVANNLDERADIYSLGILLYEMLSGADPFGFGIKAHSTTGVSWAIAHRSQPPIPLRSQPGCERVSPKLEALVLRCLQKSPHERFASVEELNGALQAAAMSGEDSEESTADRSLDSTRQGVLDLISRVQLAPPPKQDAGNSTVNRPLNPTRKRVPDTTIAHPSPPLEHGINETRISQQLTPSREGVTNASNAQIPTPSKQSSRREPTRLLFLLGVCIAIGLAAISGIYAYMQWQLRETQVLDAIKTLKTEAKFGDCIIKAKTVAQDSTLYDDAQSLLNECQVEYAKQLAAGNNFTEAIAAAKKIPEDSPLYPEAQALIKDWSEI